MILTRFWRNGDGGVAPFLALAAIPLMGFVAMAIDYSRASSVRTSFQAALDATALMLSKDANGLEPAQVAAKASGYFNALFQRPEAINVLIAHQLSAPEQGSFKLMMSGSGAVVPVFAKLLGKTQIGFSATTEVLWGMKKLNLALVLDNTGSMSSSGKMTNLKAAAHDLLATLKNAAKDPGDIKVAIVPFAVDVNVGTAHVDASWIDWTDWEEVNGTCSNTSYKKKSSCVANNKVWTTANHSTWNGCVTDRDQNNDTMNTASVAGSPATLFRAHQASACPVAMMPLSHDWIALNDKIDTMTPSGNTNVTIGLAWGFQLLSPVAPFNAPEADPNLDKVIIILTDGQNTENRWSTSTSSIDARTQKACNNIKAANMRVYTVRVIDGNASLLKNCASKTDMYYNVNEASQLSGVFSAIAQNLANLRISK
jgi:Putative Flp pilus-assembly TadE/G-like/von Willebrand factor type A domain